MAEGYIKLYRSLLDNPFATDSDMAWLWCVLLLKANHKKRKVVFDGMVVELEAGQFITGRRKLAEETGIQESKIYRTLKLFETEHQIEQLANKRFTVISILNWDKFQGRYNENEQQNEQPVNNPRTTGEQLVNTDKNDKNDKNERNIIIPADLSPKKRKSEVKKPKISFNFDTVKWENVTQKDLEVWNKAYPACDLKLEFAQMKAWILTAGSKGHKSNWAAFITRWLQKSQDRGGTHNGTDKKYR